MPPRSNHATFARSAPEREKPLCALTKLRTAGKDRRIAEMVNTRRAAGASEPHRSARRAHFARDITDYRRQHQTRSAW